MFYKGYKERHSYDREDGLWVGELTGIKDLVSFSATKEEDLEDKFHKSVDDYLDFCEEIEKQPEVPSTKFMLGDLLDVQEGIIVHQVNCRRRMASGIARQIRDKYPKHYEDYMNTDPELGNVCISHVGDRLYVAGTFSQDGYGYTKEITYTDYNALFAALETVNTYSVKTGLQVYLPYKIGCGLGNGDWDTVLYIIKRTIPDAIIVKKE